MYLTISKRFEISSSARPWRPDWDDQRNFDAYGPASRAVHGSGYNYGICFHFNGPVDRRTGMVVNVATIKERLKPLLESRYDHKFLNLDCPAFREMAPTAENLARELLGQAGPLFSDLPAKPVVCHIRDTLTSEATAYADGRVERHLWLDFSAARRTYSPRLTDEENARLFGAAASKMGHGHNYRLRVSLTGMCDPWTGLIVEYQTWHRVLSALRAELDHKNLNEEVAELQGIPITTESLARFALQRLAKDIPVNRVRLYELPDFFAEYHSAGRFALGAVRSFQAAHRLHSAALSDPENLAIYGKCDNRAGHGHEYIVEATIGGHYDETSGTLYEFAKLTGGIEEALKPWSFKHLDAETGDFADSPSTGENIVARLWPRLEWQLDGRLDRLRLWETPNNRFTLRKQVEKLPTPAEVI